MKDNGEFSLASLCIINAIILLWKTMGYDVPNDATDRDLEITRAKNEWLRDGNPVD